MNEAIKLVEANVPVECSLRVVHLHEGNSSKRQRRGASFLTIAKLIDHQGEVVSIGYAQCRSTDVPNRRVGRHVAVGRALKNFYSEN